MFCYYDFVVLTSMFICLQLTQVFFNSNWLFIITVIFDWAETETPGLYFIGNLLFCWMDHNTYGDLLDLTCLIIHRY